MLVLSRKKNESIIVSTPQGLITLYVVEIRGDKVRLGVDAPKEVPVHRSEVWEAIQQDKQRQLPKPTAEVKVSASQIDRYAASQECDGKEDS